MRNRTLGVLIGIAAVLLAVLVYLIVTLSGRKPVESGLSSPTIVSTTVTSTAAPTSFGTTTTTPKYILGEWEGKLALFLPPSTTPERVYDVYVSSLPKEEQTKLAAGIAIYDEQTLNGLIEDYTS